MPPLQLLLFVLCFKLALFTDPACVIELQCAECVPEHMPLVTSHRAANGSVRLPAGAELALACAPGKFLAYPLLGRLAARCEAGRYRVAHDAALRHILDLGCQESIFEDVLHQVDHCGSLQGRAYLMRQASPAAALHLAEMCFDADRGVATRLHMSTAALAPRPHSDSAAPLSLLGNFNHMFDASTRHAAERLYSDDERLTRRLHELLKHDRYSFAEQRLTSGRLLSGRYFEDQYSRAADFASNRVAVWRSVAAGNLRHLQHDVARLLRRGAARPLHVHAGTRGVLALRAGAGRTALYLQAGRFPVPRYVWTVVHDAQANKAVALVLLNDPFVAVSEIRDAVFCESACGRLAWLHDLHRNRNYESPVYGLVFCCSLRDFTAAVPELPPDLVRVPPGNDGLLIDLLD
uniref:DNA/RNA non-specific endonuclease domain-containing protein n=1 Tax=Heliothis virescens TaxID=7102 RepID=A0A2A4JY33_HELVI